MQEATKTRRFWLEAKAYEGDFVAAFGQEFPDGTLVRSNFEGLPVQMNLFFHPATPPIRVAELKRLHRPKCFVFDLSVPVERDRDLSGFLVHYPCRVQARFFQRLLEPAKQLPVRKQTLR